jgi:ribosomal protein S18 acetylase RimI-like enzyme
MNIEEPRPYHDEHDLAAMHHLLQQGRKAHNGSYYIHQGDLNWWLYYPPLEGDFWDQISLWDDPAQPGRLLGWALLSTAWVGFDVYVQPELRGSPQAQGMYIWAEEKAMRIARASEKPAIKVLWVLHDDDILDSHFRQRGYRRGKGYIHLSRTLEDKLLAPQVANGFVVRSCKGEVEVIARANAQYGAFQSSAPFERYQERFTRFMRSPVYDSELDIVAVAADERIGAFTIVWTDPLNQVGHFEPVGTHPAFQRQGLGRAIMLEGLHRLQERGMRSAIVSTEEDNLAAIKLYESVGFQIINRLGTYEKDV